MQRRSVAIIVSRVMSRGRVDVVFELLVVLAAEEREREDLMEECSWAE